jgi:hypothetical protein
MDDTSTSKLRSTYRSLSGVARPLLSERLRPSTRNLCARLGGMGSTSPICLLGHYHLMKQTNVRRNIEHTIGEI